MLDRSAIFRSSTFELLTQPLKLFLGTPSYLHAWFYTRDWRPILLTSWPLVLLIALVCARTITSTRQTALLTTYAAQLSSASDEGENFESPEDLLEQETTSLELDTVAKRLMASNHASKQASFFVANQLASAGQLNAGREIMKRIAGKDTTAMPKAHAWLALDRLSRLGLHSRDHREQVIVHLEAIEETKYSTPRLQAIQAELYASLGDTKRALEIFDGLRHDSTDLALKAAMLAQATGDERRFRRAYTAAEEQLNQLSTLDRQQPHSQIQAAQLAQLGEDSKAMVSLAERALLSDPDNRVAKRLLSDAYLARYRDEQSEGRAALEWLDKALKVESSNPAVERALFQLQESLATLERGEVTELLNQLEQGKSSAVAHHFLGNIAIQESRMLEAIAHLEIAYQSAPQSVAVINNLSLALASTYPNDADKVARAQSMIRGALKLAPSSVVLQDTLADILVIAGETAEAIRIYEQLLAIESTRDGVRPKLAAAYRKMGLLDLANQLSNKS